MAETSGIAKIAEKVSNDIFSVFGWERRAPRDRNWACVTDKHKKETHPSDVVFAYDDPVEHAKIFLTTDLKSYARDSISQSQVKKALKSLAMSAECAAKSSQWQDFYLDTAQNFKVLGLLFVYNHDGGFHQEFSAYLKDLTSSSIGLRRWVKVVCLGPKEINYLITVATDIKLCRGHDDKQLPEAGKCSFFYPDLVRLRVKSNSARAATIEMLTGPWQILRFDGGGKEQNRSGYHIYYAGNGDDAEEFKYIFDYLFRHQLVKPDEQITVRMPMSSNQMAGVNFDKAKEQYAFDFFPYGGLDDIKNRLSAISFVRINTVMQQFSDIDLGME